MAPGLQVEFVKTKQKTWLNILLTVEGLQRMLKKRHYCAADVLIPFAAALADRGLSVVERSDLTRMKMVYTETVSKRRLDQIDGL